MGGGVMRKGGRTAEQRARAELLDFEANLVALKVAMRAEKEKREALRTLPGGGIWGSAQVGAGRRGGNARAVARPPSRGGSGRGGRAAAGVGSGSSAPGEAAAPPALGVAGTGDRVITLRRDTAREEAAGALRFSSPKTTTTPTTVSGGYGGDEELDEDAWRPAGAVASAEALAVARDAGTGGDGEGVSTRRAYVVETDTARPELVPPKVAVEASTRSAGAGVEFNCQTGDDDVVMMVDSGPSRPVQETMECQTETSAGRGGMRPTSAARIGAGSATGRASGMSYADKMAAKKLNRQIADAISIL